jgi:plastocyanin
MEQKQLDEEDSYFGEEFIDDDLLDEQPIKEAPKVEIIEEAPAVEGPLKEKKASSKKKVTKKAKIEEEITITPVSEDLGTDPIAEKLDPWADDEEDNTGLFKEVSTWKALTGIAVILLVLSLFTQGFDFTGAAVANTENAGASISMVEAEQRALQFVNNNLLQPPFLAELQTSKEMGSLYMVTLNVAGQDVDSYVTKDGELFFPQGFDVSGAIPFAGGAEVAAEMPSEEVVVEEVALEEAAEMPAEEAVVEEVVVEEPVPEPAASEPVQLSVSARRWLFEPDTLSVTPGSEVILTLNPEGLNFMFSIPDLGVAKEVSGPTTVQFTAPETGSFEFMCADCEDFRGMTGMLVVE